MIETYGTRETVSVQISDSQHNVNIKSGPMVVMLNHLNGCTVSVQ